MASNDDPFSGYASAEPEQQQAVAPADMPPRGDDPFSGYGATPVVTAKMKAVGTDASPQDAGSTFSSAVKTNTPPEVIKADPASFQKSQQDKEAVTAIDNDADLAHFVNTVPDAAAISSGDWSTLATIAKHAADVALPVVDNFIQQYVTKPAVEYGQEGVRLITEQGYKEATDPDFFTRMKSGWTTAKGVMSILAAPIAPELEAMATILEKAGIPRDQQWPLFFGVKPRMPWENIKVPPEGPRPGYKDVTPRPPGPPMVPSQPRVMLGGPSVRDSLEQFAASFEEFEPKDIKTWSDDELKQYTNQKFGISNAAQDLAEVQTPRAGVDKGIDVAHIVQTNTDSDTIGRLLQAVQESKTKERSPEAMEAFLNLKGLGDKDVWLPSNEIAESYRGLAPHPDDKQFGWIDDIAQTLPDAAETGTEISVPLSKFLAHVDPAALTPEIKDQIRFGDNGLSPIEADQWIENYHERFAEDAEKEDLAQQELPPEERLPTNAGPQEYGAENFLPMMEDIKAKPGANTARLAKLLGPKLYGEPTNMDKVTVKELLQNAADAVDAAVEKGLIPEGAIHLRMDSDNRVIAMTDNGTGMAPETLAKEFLEIAGTKKESLNPKGGFGIAKMLINFGNKGLHVMTMRDGKVAEMNTHGEELLAALQDPDLAPKIEVRSPTAADRKFFPNGHGTHIEVTIPEKFKDTQTGEERPIDFETHPFYHPGLVRSPLFGSKIKVHVEGLTGGTGLLKSGLNFPVQDYTQFPPAKFDWGTAQIYVSKQPRPKDQSWLENIHFLSNGIWQYSDNLKVNPLDYNSEIIPHDFYIDLHPKVKPEDAGYPFDLNRQGMTKEAKKSFTQVLNYLSKTYSQLDFAAQVQSYGAISYLRPGKGGVEVSTPATLQPKIPPTKTSMTGLKESDVIEFKGDTMYVNGKKMPSLTNEDLAKAEIKIDELMVDQGMIKPDQVMLHSSMEINTAAPPPAPTQFEKWAKQIDDLLKAEGLDPLDKPYTLGSVINHLTDLLDSAALQDAFRKKLERYLDTIEAMGPSITERRALSAIAEHLRGKPAENWVPLDQAAREKFGAKFDEFMYEVGNTFIRLRNGIVDMMGKEYEPLRKEAIGISFDQKYRGVSIRVPFSGSFINPAVPQYSDEPIKAAVGVWGTMVHELAHHKVRSHNADFPAEMQKIQIWLDAAQIINNSNVSSNYINRQGMINALTKTFDKHWEIFQWLNKVVTDPSQTRNRGRRIKGTDERLGEEGSLGTIPRELGGLAEEAGAGAAKPTGTGPTQSSEIHSDSAKGRGFLFNETEQLAQILLHAEKKSLYLAPLGNFLRPVMGQKAWTGYAKKLQNNDEMDYEKALAAAHKEVQRTLEPAWKNDFNEIRQEVESDFRSASDIAANNSFRMGKLPTGETREPLKLDRTAVEYMGGKDALKDITAVKGGVHPDDVAPTFGYQSGRELVQALVDFDKSRGRATPEKYINQLIDEEANRRMAAKYGDLRERIAERAQEIALENHHVDILIDELKHLAAASGQMPFTLEQIEKRVDEIFARTPAKKAKYQTYQRAVFKQGRLAEEHLLGGKVDKAFKAKQTQLIAVLSAKRARSFESYKKSQENSFKRLVNNETLSGVEQPYKDFATDILTDLGYGPRRAHTDHGALQPFVDSHNGSIAAAYWIYDKNAPINNPRGNTSTGAHLLYDNLTVEEFTDLAKTIQSFLHNGRNEKKINTAYGKANLENAVRDLAAQQARFPVKRQPGTPLTRTWPEWARHEIRWWNAQHMLVEKIFDYGDKFDPRGAASTYLDRPFREAYNLEIKLQEATVKKLKYIRDKYVDKSIYDDIDNREIMDPNDPGNPFRMNRWQFRNLLGYVGSESGLKRVLEGFKITEDQLEQLIVRNATKADIEYNNLMWELHEDLWKRSAMMQERVTGVPADPLKPRSFGVKLSTGEIVNARGGYKEVNYDRTRSTIQEDVMMKGDLFEPTYTVAITPHAYTKPRTQYTGWLDLDSLQQSSHLAGMIHDIAFREPVLDARKILLGKDGEPYRRAVAMAWGQPTADLFRDFLKDVANSHAIEDDFAQGLSRFLAVMRQQITSSMIFLKPGVAIKHLFSAFGMSATRVGVKPLVSGIYDVGIRGMLGAAKDMLADKGMEADPDFISALKTLNDPTHGPTAREFIYNSSPMMRQRRRARKDTVREAMNAMRRYGFKQGLVDVKSYSEAVGRLMVALSDAMSADGEWKAAYDRHFQQTSDHDEAVFVADKAVSSAHGSNFVGDRSAIMRSRNAIVRNSTLLFTFFNHWGVNMAHLIWDTKALVTRGRGSEPGAYVTSIGARIGHLLAMVVLGEALVAWYQGRESFGKQLLMSIIRLPFMGWMYGRDLANLATGGFDPEAGALGIGLKHLAQVGLDVGHLAQGKASNDWIRHAFTMMGDISGIGGEQLGQTAQGVTGAVTGKEVPENRAEAWRQFWMGHPRPRSRYRQ